jgi:hypothetical protein
MEESSSMMLTLVSYLLVLWFGANILSRHNLFQVYRTSKKFSLWLRIKSSDLCGASGKDLGLVNSSTGMLTVAPHELLNA